MKESAKRLRESRTNCCVKMITTEVRSQVKTRFYVRETNVGNFRNEEL